MAAIRSILLEQKYLELIEEGLKGRAERLLDSEIVPLKSSKRLIIELESYNENGLSREELYRLASWKGKEDRSRVLEDVQALLPPGAMFAPKRLKHLLQLAIDKQVEKLCPYHELTGKKKTDTENVSLLTSHCCSVDQAPVHVRHKLDGHKGEVLCCAFSPNGLKLAIASKDKSFKIWTVKPHSFEFTLKQTMRDIDWYVVFLVWSPDSKHLIVGGSERSPKLSVWDVEQFRLRSCEHCEEGFSCAAFNRDGSRYATGSRNGLFFVCDMNGRLIYKWKNIYVVGLNFMADGKTVLAADKCFRLRGYVNNNSTTGDYDM